MSRSLKKAVQDALLLPRKKQYDKDFNRLLKDHQKRCEELRAYVTSDEIVKETKSTVRRLEIGELSKNLSNHVKYEYSKFFLVFDATLGILREESERTVYEYLKNNPLALMLYGDEDYFAVSKDFNDNDSIKAGRAIRFFKPCFSPDTLSSFDYINAFAVNGEVLNNVLEEFEDEYLKLDKESLLYSLTIDICAKLTREKKEKSIQHISSVFVSFPIAIDSVSKANDLNESGEMLYAEFKKIPPLFSDEKYKNIRQKAIEKLELIPSNDNPSVSLIIPSKDNPDMLISCIDKLNLSGEKNVELIVVDNGSNKENKERIEEYLNNLDFENKYIHDVYEFNYSKMNNIAAKEAKGEVLILLNDDIEASGNEWIQKIAGMATSKKAGCVGCKLVYPDGKIQHVGIAGGVDGPAHKFMGEKDEDKVGFGDNTMNKNVLAVTGACLAIRKELYEEAGGLFEDLKVGYNDVDLCMTLFEKGYRNILLNDIKLVHHESVSRGRDAKNRIKSERLYNEKEILKERHKSLMTIDPYEGGCSDFKLDFEKEYEDKTINAKGKFESRKSNDDEGWVYSSFEELKVYKEEKKKILLARGFALVPGIDNMRFDFDLILEKDDKQFVIPIKRNLRLDLAGRFNGSRNTDLCGMNIRAEADELESGTYLVKIYAKDHGNVREIITDTTQRISI
ncbi:MAG: glycosyltransferase [Lachnospiraceae bacterium]|nr:glycosyltransferase [Lachnospiraceae bacterium]